MRKRILSFFLILLLALALIPASFADDGTAAASADAQDEAQFGPGAVVERDESGNPVSVNGCPVREVTAGINLRSNREAYQYSVWFTDYPFFQPATQYDGNLAVMSLAMALSANRAMNPSEDGNASFDPSLHLQKYLTDAGFSDIRKDDYSKETSMYTISMAMGSRIMQREGEEPFTLIAIGVCGGGYGNEWQSNMTPGSDELHKGFLSASQLVIDRLAGYILTNGIEGNIKVWISGFSRAAAVSNVTAGLLVRDGMFPKENVYAYTFATPAAVHNAPNSGCENIFNIINPMDVVPQVMPYDWDFARFGTDLFIPVTEFSSTGDTYTYSRAAYARDTFGIEANYSPALNLRMRLLLSMIMDVAENREQYNEHLQPAVVGVMQNGNASNLLSTVRSLLLTVKDKGSAGRMNVDTLVNYVARVFGNVLTRTELDDANANTGNIALRLFNEHCEDAYLANIDLLRAGTFEDDTEFTYVFIRGPVDVTYLSDASGPNVSVTLTEKGELLADRLRWEANGNDPDELEAFLHQRYMERVGDTSIVAVPRDANVVIGWEATRGGTVEVRYADCSVHASSVYHGGTAAARSVKKHDAGMAFRYDKDVGAQTDGFEPTDFTAAEIASFMGVDSVGVNWRVTLMLLAALAGILVTVLIWVGLLLNRAPKKPGAAVWICLGVFCIAMLEAELAFWFFADHTNLRMLWKMILGAALLVIFLIRHWRSKRTLLMLPGFFMLIAADVVMCLYVLQGAILFTVAHALLIFAFLYKSPMPLKMWIQWFVVSAIASVLIVFGFLPKIGTLAWGAAFYAVVLLLLNYTAGGQLPRARFAARLFLLSEAILLIFMTVFTEPILHILSVLMFDTALLLIAVSKTGVEQPKEEPAPEEEHAPEEPASEEPAPKAEPPVPEETASEEEPPMQEKPAPQAN
ncbi:MAG: hypothetical protein IKP38_03700 [Clostridia bacterium]|nr:hypothetical protein [Clostridia bacterium]